MPSPIYLDFNATTPVDERVLKEMLPYFSQHFGNASSKTHAFGWVAANAVEESREKTANILGCEKQEIIFTSGATESINLAMKGIFSAMRSKGDHIITAKTEHNAVLHTCAYLESIGARITYLDVDHEGKINIDQLKNSITDKTILVSVMLANNETGTLQDIKTISEITHTRNAILFSDTTQAIGKMRVDVNELGIDACCISAHKIYGPKGVGALFLRRKDPRVSVIAQMHGGGHERNLRAGTLNVPGIVGLGKACEIAAEEWWNDSHRLSVMRTKFEQRIQDSVGDVVINGSMKDRLPNTTNLTIRGIKADKLISTAPLLAMSTGSACTSAIPEPSHVLSAMGIPEQDAYSTIRISLGRMTTEEDMKKAGDELCTIIPQLRYKGK